jgi:hypothetical protein
VPQSIDPFAVDEDRQLTARLVDDLHATDQRQPIRLAAREAIASGDPATFEDDVDLARLLAVRDELFLSHRGRVRPRRSRRARG